MTKEQEFEFMIEELKTRVASVDLCSAARKIGAGFSDSKLTIKLLGKDLTVDSKGNLTSDIHLHRWVAIPVLSHIIQKKQRDTSFRRMGAVEGTANRQELVSAF